MVTNNDFEKKKKDFEKGIISAKSFTADEMKLLMKDYNEEIENNKKDIKIVKNKVKVLKNRIDNLV